MRAKGVGQHDLLTVWTDVVIQFGRLVRTNKYQHQDHLGGYIQNLCQYMTLNYFRSKRTSRLQYVAELPVEGFEDVVIEHSELSGLIAKLLNRLGGVCKEVLYLWSMSYSMQEIMERLGIKSVAATRKRKHDCLKRLLSTVEGTQLYQELLNSYRS